MNGLVRDAQSISGQYQKIGILMFGIGVTLSVLGEIELAAILLKIHLNIVPKLMSPGATFYSPIFYLILGNLMMLVEYQFLRKKSTA